MDRQIQNQHYLLKIGFAHAAEVMWKFLLYKTPYGEVIESSCTVECTQPEG